MYITIRATNFGLEQNFSSEFIFPIMKIKTVRFYSLLKAYKSKKYHTAVQNVTLAEPVKKRRNNTIKSK